MFQSFTGPDKFRRSFGTFHLRDGVRIDTVATFMGRKETERHARIPENH